MDAGLLVGVAGLGGEPERCREFRAGGGGLPGLIQGRGEAAEREDLASRSAGPLDRPSACGR